MKTSARHSPAGFGRMASAWFLGLAGLYVLYASSTFLGPESGLSVRDRLLMVFGPTTVAFSLLISPAVFAAALERFRPFGIEAPSKRGAYWAYLAVFALVACALSALGPHFAVSLMPLTPEGPPEDALLAPESVLAITRLLIPLAMGLLTLLAGVAGALVGHATTDWPPRRRDAARWLACLAMLASFLVPLLIGMNLVLLHQAPAYWIVVGPLAIPLLLVGTLAWRLRDTLGLHLGRREDRATVDPDTLDRIVTAVTAASEHSEPRLEDLASTDFELEMAQLAAGIRREVAGRATISESRVQKIVTAMLEAPPARVPKAAVVAPNPTLEPGQVGVFGTSWACLAVGLVIVSPLGGVPPNLLSAVGVGLLGSIAVTLIARRYPSLSDTVPI